MTLNKFAAEVSQGSDGGDGLQGPDFLQRFVGRRKRRTVVVRFMTRDPGGYKFYLETALANIELPPK